MEDLRGFVLDKLTTIEMDMDAATSGTCERLQNGPVGPHKAAMLMPCRAPSMIATSIVLAHLIRDRRCAKVRRRREAPPHHNYLALCVSGNADNWRHSVRVDGWKAREIAREIALDPKEAPHGLLAAGDALDEVIAVSSQRLSL